MNGFITLHRKMTQWEWYQDNNTFRVFVHLLLKASWKDTTWQGIEVKRGQVIIGRKALAKQTQLTERQVRTALQKLQTTSEVTIKSTNKYSILTIENYSKYQDKRDDNDQQNVQQSATKTTTSKQYNNITSNTEGSNPSLIPSDFKPNEVNQKWLDDSGLSEFDQRKVIRDFVDFWLNAKSKKKNWDLAFRKNPVVNRVVNTAASKKTSNQFAGVK